MPLKRFGVSLESELLSELDRMAEKQRFPNRSQAIRHLITKNLVEDKWNSDEVVAGAVLIVYDHNLRELHEKVNSLQHEYHCLILAGQHIHLDDHNCLELIAVKGKACKLKKLADKLKAIKGVKHGDLVMTATS
jgi:CopG family transcriptional regulator, nickel-responsive regulator